jgi:hypothetical protein
MIRTAIEALIDRYVRLDPETLTELGADRFPPAPIHSIRSGP